ncbi:ABC transporter permease [Aestuariivirga sp.]|uniref:ABC transporter permease n=1 Tax=Aestuariivirga sp. TaxID=2650926 RepID=UPI00391CBCC0
MGAERRNDLYAIVWRLPLLIWQLLFFVVPLGFMFVMSFWVVRNYRMVPDFSLANWEKILGWDIFWKAYAFTFLLATLSTVITSAVAFPAAYGLAFKVSDAARRWAIFLLIIPFFTSYLVRVYAWQVVLGGNGVINGLLGVIGIEPLAMLNSPVGTIIGYLTLTLPLVVILQTISLASIDKTLVEAAHNLGCGRFRTVHAVIVPAAKVGLVVAALFCFILSFGDFVSPYYLGGSKPPTLSIMIIDSTKSGQQWPRAAVIAVMMILTLLAVAFAAVGTAYRRRG